MEMPSVRRCFGMFPPKYATYLISIFGMASGGVGLGVVVLYGIAEDSIIAHFVTKTKVNEDIKKVVLLTIGLSSLLLLIANFLLFIGATSRAPGAVVAGYLTILANCLIIMGIFISLPVSCFFLETACLIKKLSPILTVISVLIVTAYLEVWFYFMVVAWNYGQEL